AAKPSPARGGGRVGLDAHPEVIALGGSHIRGVGALALLHLRDGGGGTALGGGAVRGGGGGGGVGGWGRCLANYDLDFATILICQSCSFQRHPPLLLVRAFRELDLFNRGAPKSWRSVLW